jgi:3-mercaptopropionate dioxygenase
MIPATVDGAVAGGRAAGGRAAGAARCPAALLTAIRAATATHTDWAQTATLVAGALRRRLPPPDILTGAERAGSPDGYAQHVLHIEADGSFSVVAVVWRPGQMTPIHDHVTWCVAGVLQGTEHEELYELCGDGDGGMVRTAVRDNPAGSVTGFAPPGDIHRVRNERQPATIAIHVYGADIGRLGSSVRRCYALPALPARRD